MAIVEFINKPNRTYAGMRSVINYVLNPDKTTDALTTGIGVNPANAYNEMVALKQIMGKTDKRLWYHFVQSFPPYDNITPALALEIALKTAEYWKDEYQILIAVHTDSSVIIGLNQEPLQKGGDLVLFSFISKQFHTNGGVIVRAAASGEHPLT